MKLNAATHPADCTCGTCQHLRDEAASGRASIRGLQERVAGRLHKQTVRDEVCACGKHKEIGQDACDACSSEKVPP